MPSECGLATTATMTLSMAGSDNKIRQRMEACQQGIRQLDSLRLKHQRLMEHLRSQYPDFVTPHIRQQSHHFDPHQQLQSQISSSIPRHHVVLLPHSVASTPQHPGPPPPPPPAHAGDHLDHVSPVNPHHHLHQHVLTTPSVMARCDSPQSTCMGSHRSSVSMDSGYTSVASDPFTASPMSYSTYRKKAATLDRADTAHAVRSLGSGVPEAASERLLGRVGGRRQAVQRPQSMYAVLPSSEALDSSRDRPRGKFDDLDALSGVSVAATAKKLMDSAAAENGLLFGPPIPPLRKAATLNRTPPRPLPRTTSATTNNVTTPSMLPLPLPTTFPSSSIPSNSSKSAPSTLRSRPLPQFAKLETPHVGRQSAQVYAPAFAKPVTASSTATATSSPPAPKPRRYIVPIMSGSNTPEPPNVLSRQQSTASTIAGSRQLAVHSPLEARKRFLATPHTVSCYGVLQSRPPTSGGRIREKIWQESEGL